MTEDRQGLWDQDAAIGLSVVLVLLVSWLSLVACSLGIHHTLAGQGVWKSVWWRPMCEHTGGEQVGDAEQNDAW